jgi:hypothetical protein
MNRCFCSKKSSSLVVLQKSLLLSTRHCGTSTSGSDEHTGQQDQPGGIPLYNFKTYTGSERKKHAARWENAFYGKLTYEPGMRERYATAIEDEDRFDQEIQKETERRGVQHQQEVQQKGRHHARADGDRDTPTQSDAAHSSGALLIPTDAEDLSESDLRDGGYSDDEIKKYIIRTLTTAERRIIYALDYGSFRMMDYFASGEMKLNEAEAHLKAFGYMNRALEIKIRELRDDLRERKEQVDL